MNQVKKITQYVLSFDILFIKSYLVIAKSKIATTVNTESDAHSAISNWLNALRMSGFDNMRMLSALPIKPKVPEKNTFCNNAHFLSMKIFVV